MKYIKKQEDKDKKIKSNQKNIIEYLKSKDLWGLKVFNNRKFDENLLQIKELNIKIKEILYFYYYLVSKDGEDENEDEIFEKEVTDYLN